MKYHFLLVLGVVFLVLSTSKAAQSQSQFKLKASEIRDYNPNDDGAPQLLDS